MSELSDIKKRNGAHALYIAGDLTQKEIAASLHTTEQSVSTWVHKYGWKQERDARQSDRETLALLEEQLSFIREYVKSADDPAARFAMSAPLADAILKMQKAKHAIIQDTTQVQAAKLTSEITRFIAKRNPELAQKVAPHLTDFVKQMD